MEEIKLNVQAIFEAARSIESRDDRETYLQKICGTNDEIGRRVRALLKAYEENESFLESPAVEGVFSSTKQSAENVGTVIGPYKLLQQLGEGGMGTVFLAEQIQPFQRKVAIKVIKPGMDSRQVLARFEQERQALAVMDHPNIAKVLDAGTTEGGRPYFVMELVQGVPITLYCDQEHRTLKERLELFIPVCQAVQHAHQKGIIHRDLKPSNVLVALYDGRPVPKVIDFGVAKAAGQKLTEESMLTEIGQVVGTIEYMAPEQAELDNIDIDTRADIYGLGIVLYELLAGSPPFTRDQLRNVVFTEMLRMIREVEPSKPSTKLSGSTELPSIAAKRRLDPKPLTRLVQGDLDWIVMRCLEKDRARRYETANGLAMDIGRYLADEPVMAGPPSAVYRLRKLLRRNRGPVFAAVLVLISLLLGVTCTTLALVRADERRWEAEQARAAEGLLRMEAEGQKQLALVATEEERKAKDRESARAEGERRAKEEAEKNLGYAKKGIEILRSVFTDLDPTANYLTVAELRNALRDNLNKAVKELEASAIGNPLEVAEMQTALGDSLLNWGEAALAVEVLQKARTIREARLGPDHAETLNTISNLGMAYLASDQLDKAVPLLEQTLAKRKAKLETDHPATLLSMNNLAAAYRSSGRLDRALPLLEQAVEKSKTRLGPDNPRTLRSMNNLATAYKDSGQPDRAQELFRMTLKKTEGKLGIDYRDTLVSMNGLAVTYWNEGLLNESIPLLEAALKSSKEKLGRQNPLTLQTLANLGVNYKDAGRLEEALPLLEETYRFSKKHYDLGWVGPQLLDCYLKCATRKNAELSRTLVQELLASARQEHPKESTQLASRLAGFGLVLLKVEAFSDAEPILLECLAIREKKDAEGWSTFNTKSMLGGSLLGQKKYAEAEPLLIDGYQGMKKREASIPPQFKFRLLEAGDRLAQLYGELGQRDKADKWRKTVEEGRAALKPPSKK